MCFASPLSIVLARSLPSNFSVRPSAPSVSLRSAVRGCARVLPLHRSSIRRLLVIPCVCSLAVSVERPSEGGRERGRPCRRCSPSSSLNTAAILLPDQVRSRCSLVCSLGWMEHGTSGAHSIPFPAPPLVPRTSCDSAIAMLAGAWCHILHPQCAALSASRGCVGRPRKGARATPGSSHRHSLIIRPRASDYPRKYRTYYGACGCWLEMMAMILPAGPLCLSPNKRHIPH